MSTTEAVAPLTMLAIARSIATHLANWTAKPGEHGDYYALLVHPDGPVIDVGNRGVVGPRVEFTGRFPRDKQNGYYSPRGGAPSITVATRRPGLEMAREIERRLLPEYLPAYRKAVEQRNAANKANDDAVALVRELGAILNTKPHNEKIGSGVMGITVYDPHYVAIEVRRSGEARFTIDADRKLAVRLAKLFASLSKRGE